MSIILSIIDHEGNDKKFITAFSDQEVEQLIKTANERNMRTLSMVDTIGNTILNKKQALDILNDIKILIKDNVINRTILDLVRLGAEEVVHNPNAYIKFEGE